MLKIKKIILGPMSNNTFIVFDDESKEATIIDPAMNQGELYQRIQELGISVSQIWLTHPHFDHTGGIPHLLEMITPKPEIYLHEAGVPLWKNKGGATMFNLSFPSIPIPQNLIKDGDLLTVGSYSFSTIHTPGHTESDCCFHCKEENVLFSGDVLFSRSIGRTDLPGGDTNLLLKNIHEKIFILPDVTIVYPGHGASTSIKREKLENPFL